MTLVQYCMKYLLSYKLVWRGYRDGRQTNNRTDTRLRWLICDFMRELESYASYCRISFKNSHISWRNSAYFRYSGCRICSPICVIDYFSLLIMKNWRHFLIRLVAICILYRIFFYFWVVPPNSTIALILLQIHCRAEPRSYGKYDAVFNVQALLMNYEDWSCNLNSSSRKTYSKYSWLNYLVSVFCSVATPNQILSRHYRFLAEFILLYLICFISYWSISVKGCQLKLLSLKISWMALGTKYLNFGSRYFIILIRNWILYWLYRSYFLTSNSFLLKLGFCLSSISWRWCG